MNAPRPDAPLEGWLTWVNSAYPYSREAERKLAVRGSYQRTDSIASGRMLEDLRGLRDRSTAAYLGSLWVKHEIHGWKGERRP